MPITQADLDAVAQLVIQVAPELCDCPPYVLVRPGDMPTGCCCAFADNRTVDFRIRRDLEALGRWRGQGPCIVVQPDGIIASAGDDASLFSGERQLCGLLLHELSHLLPPGKRPPDVDYADPILRARQAAEHDAWSRTSGCSRHLPPWFPDHAAPFIRSAVHCWYRALRLGCYLDPATIGFGGTLYSMSGEHLYVRAFADEPLRMAGATFAQIHALPMPAAVLDLLRFDCRFFFSLKSQQPIPLEQSA